MTRTEPSLASSRLRTEIRTFLALSEARPAAAPEVLDETREADFTRKLVTFLAEDGEAIQAFLFEPLATCRGAVLALHQHNSDWALGKSEIAGLAGDLLQAFGPALVRFGLTVLAPDALGFESRRSAAGAGSHSAPPRPQLVASDWLQYYNHAMHRLARGELLMKKLLGDIGAAISALQALVPAVEVGVVGHSFGGNLALFAAALDTRISVAVSSGALCSYREKFARGTGLEMALAIPGFASRFDFDDLLRCIAPRRVLIVSSDDDPFAADADDVVARAMPAFESMGAAPQLRHFRNKGPHALDPERFTAIVDFFSRYG